MPEIIENVYHDFDGGIFLVSDAIETLMKYAETISNKEWSEKALDELDKVYEEMGKLIDHVNLIKPLFEEEEEGE